MQTVGIKALKNNLSEYIRAVAAGDTVLVTDRGRVVAEITPARIGSDTSTPEQRLAELAQLGLVTPAKRPMAGPPPHLPVASFDALLEEFEADREDR